MNPQIEICKQPFEEELKMGCQRFRWELEGVVGDEWIIIWLIVCVGLVG